MTVNDLPVDERIKKLIMKRGIVSLYPPQEKAFKTRVLQGGNLVLATPTASGKTLVAEIVMAHRILKDRIKALYLVPLKAIATEKYHELKAYEEIGLKVALTTGDYDSDDAYLERYDIIITTNEKADSLLRHKAPWFRDVGIIVIDEIHYIDDGKRGPVIESIIARLKALKKDIQMLALSATISNVNELASWLEAEYVCEEWRPVKLLEGVYHKGEIIFNTGERRRIKRVYNDPLLDLIYDTIVTGGQALIFVNARSRAVSLAEKIAKRTKLAPGPGISKYVDLILRSSDAVKLNEKLANLFAYGVSFHHAGLGFTQRKIIEDAFRNNALRVIVATPTLAAGVNLPARRVIVYDYTRYEPLFGRVYIKVMEYKQFAGRAGRPGYDEVGEAILIARHESDVKDLFNYYILSKPESILSKLASEAALRSQLLALIATEHANNLNSLYDILSRTLYAKQYGLTEVKRKIPGILEFLEEAEMIKVSRETLEPTRIGKRVTELYIDPLSAYRIIQGLRVRRINATDFAYLHLISTTPDMTKLHVSKKDYPILEEILDEKYDELLIDVFDRDEVREYLILSEVKTALLLYDWINEVSEDELTEKYDVGPGDIYNIVETAEWLLYSAIELAKIIHVRHDILKKISLLRERVKYGVKEELLELVKLKGIGRVRARALYNSGYRTLEDLAKAPIEKLVQVRGIGVEIAKSIKEQLGISVEKSSLEKAKMLDKSKRKLTGKITDYL